MFTLLYICDIIDTIEEGSNMKIKLKVPRERNQFVAAALFRKAGAHRKSNKASRKLENQRILRDAS